MVGFSWRRGRGECEEGEDALEGEWEVVWERGREGGGGEGGGEAEGLGVLTV
jgi:hypothetical protein